MPPEWIKSSLGQGNAGSITIDARDTVVKDNSVVETIGTGNGGDIRVTTGTLSLTNGGLLYSSARENAGSITINARDAITIDGTGKNTNGLPSGLFSYLPSGGAGGKGGDIQLTTGSLTVTNGGRLVSSTLAQGNAGNINLTTGSFSLTNGSQLTSSTSGQGNAGNINLTTGSFSLTNGSQLVSSTSGGGNGGNITIGARDTVRFDGVGSNQNPTGAYSTVESGGMGSAGSINVTTGSLFLNNGSQLSAGTFGQGNAGDISINVRDAITLNGTGSNGRSSAVFSQVGTGGVGKGGNLSLATGSLSLTNGAQLVSSTNGRGNGGNITIDARDTVRFDGVGSNQNPTGAYSTVDSGGMGKAGSINVTTGSLSLNNGSLLSTSTSGQGNAGDISVNARDAITIDGTGSNGNSITGITPVKVY